MINEKIKKCAIEAVNCFSKQKRTDESEFYVANFAPAWVMDMIREAHMGMLPDDHKYRFVVESLYAIIEANGNFEETQIQADIYTSDLSKWLISNNTRMEYCNEACEQFDVPKDAVMFDRIQIGQLQEKSEVLEIVKTHLLKQG